MTSKRDKTREREINNLFFLKKVEQTLIPFLIAKKRRRMSSSLSDYLSELTNKLNVIFGISFIVIGGIGGILNIITFISHNLVKTSCGIYFLFGSMFSVGLIVVGQLFRLLTLSNSSIFLTTFWYCQIRIYFINVFGLISRLLIVLTSLDRLLFCSRNAQTRSWCNYKLALRVVVVCIVISLAYPIHVWFSYELRLPSRSCRSDIYWLSTYDLCYQFIFVFILPSLLMSIFCLMLISRLHGQRIRLSRQMNRRDREFLLMILIQVLFYIVIHLPLPINMTYNRLALYLVKSRDRIAIENFFSFLINSQLFYFYFSLTFYLNLIVSSKFRQQLFGMFKRRSLNGTTIRNTTRIAPVNPSNRD